jgi:hypothetical protein
MGDGRMQALVSMVVDTLATILYGLIEIWIDSWWWGKAERPDPDHSDPAGSGT